MMKGMMWWKVWGINSSRFSLIKQQYALLRAWNDTFEDKRFVDTEVITILCRSSFNFG